MIDIITSNFLTPIVLDSRCSPEFIVLFLTRLQKVCNSGSCEKLRTTQQYSLQWVQFLHLLSLRYKNKPRTAKVGAISKAQNLKGGPFGLCETPAGCKKFKKNWRGDPLETWKNFPKKFFNEIFKQCHGAEKCKRGPFAIFWHPLCCKILKQMKGDPLMQSKKLQKKSHSAEKKWG